LVLFKDIEANGGFETIKRRNQKKNPGKCRQRTRAFDSGKEIFWELINTQTKTTE
jgi:hypothetical protein